jgi:hypothetical protein
VAALGALLALLAARQRQIASGGNLKPTSAVGAEQPLPHSAPDPTTAAQTPAATPDDLLEARRSADER